MAQGSKFKSDQIVEQELSFHLFTDGFVKKW